MSKRNPTTTPKPTTTSKRPRRTEAQHERDTTRETSGRFAALNPCELCGKSCGARAYTSDERCNVAGATHGLGVVLHPRCGAVLATLDDETFAAVLVAARDVRRARVGELPRASCDPTGRCRYHGAGGPASRACGGDDYAGAVRTCTDCGRESVGGAYHWPSCPQLRDNGVCPLCGGRERAGVCEGDCTNEPGLAEDRNERFARAARPRRARGGR